ncbi:MAG: hypothetical protein CMH56_08455 [Myxococcales bacterium]|nr:hypothetical protein [Myxococcales bacterium]|tara:strand:- start:4157 stop:5026 length:870 start_codon:yes stop_codon:yes gene_type:complete
MTNEFFDGCVIMGQGKAGSALAKALSDAGISISAIVSRSQATKVPDTFSTLEKWQQHRPKEKPVFFIAWPDGEVATAVSQIINLDIQPKAVIHLSGACAADVWLPLGNRCPTGTFHPNEVLKQHQGFGENIGVGVEASSPELHEALVALAGTLNLSVVSLEGVDRGAYHLAAVTVANLSLVLVQHAIKLWTDQGFSNHEAQNAMGNLLRSCAERVITASPDEILTGPVARADVATIKNHLDFLNSNPDHEALLQTYRLLSEQLLALTSHDLEIRQQLTALFQGTSDHSK